MAGAHDFSPAFIELVKNKMTGVGSPVGIVFDPEFVQLMENRMATSYHKYGPWAKNSPFVDALANVERRVKIYNDTGNREGLVDGANFLMMEYMLPKHPRHHLNDVGYRYVSVSPFMPELEGRMNVYRESGNKDGLVDGVVILMTEFLRPSHDQAHFRSESAEESPGIICLPEEMPTKKSKKKN